MRRNYKSKRAWIDLQTEILEQRSEHLNVELHISETAGFFATFNRRGQRSAATAIHIFAGPAVGLEWHQLATIHPKGSLGCFNDSERLIRALFAWADGKLVLRRKWRPPPRR